MDSMGWVNDEWYVAKASRHSSGPIHRYRLGRFPLCPTSSNLYLLRITCAFDKLPSCLSYTPW